MQYSLDIKKENVLAHIDIEQDIQKRKNGQITFTIRLNSGNIVDYNLVEYANAATKYLSLKSIAVAQFSVPCDIGERSEGDAIRPNNLQFPSKER